MYWRGTREQLRELVDMHELAEFEWRAVARRHYNNYEERQQKGQPLDLERHMASVSDSNNSRTLVAKRKFQSFFQPIAKAARRVTALLDK